jgi:hypothetical protein
MRKCMMMSSWRAVCETWRIRYQLRLNGCCGKVCTIEGWRIQRIRSKLIVAPGEREKGDAEEAMDCATACVRAVELLGV